MLACFTGGVKLVVEKGFCPTCLLLCLAAIKDNNTAKDLSLSPVPCDIRTTSRVLVIGLIRHVEKSRRCECIASIPRLFLWYLTLSINPVLVELVFVSPVVQLIQMGADLVASNDDKLDKA